MSHFLDPEHALRSSLDEVRKYESGREIFGENFGNAYQRKKIDTNDAFQKHFFHRVHQTIQQNKMFAKQCALSFHNTRVPSAIVCLTRSLMRIETEPRFLRTLYA